MCRCQPTHKRTSYSSSPTSCLASLKASSKIHRAGHAHQFRQRYVSRTKTGVVGQVLGIGDAATHQQPMLLVQLRPGAYRQPTPIVEARSLAPITSAQTLPLVIGYLLGQFTGHLINDNKECAADLSGEG